MLIFVLRVLCLDTKRERRWIMAKIVVWGAGIGGMTAAYELRAYLGREHSVTVVGDGPRFSFTPSNPWVCVGWRKADDVVLKVGRHLARKNIACVDAAATEIRAAQNLLVTRDGKEPPCDDGHASAGRDKSGAALSRPFACMQPL